MNALHDEIAENGFALLRGFIDQVALDEMVRDSDRLLADSPPGVRELAAKSAAVRAFAASGDVQRLVRSVLGSPGRLVRSILFNKDAGANWHVAWHQDLSIAVRERFDADGYSGWSQKDGFIHVQPPVEVLQQMLTLRLHLDHADESNGALRVAVGSHQVGRVPAGDAARLAGAHQEHMCIADAGDLLVMRPLILHASNKASNPNPRRVVHLEFSTYCLPKGCSWAEEDIALFYEELPKVEPDRDIAQGGSHPKDDPGTR